MQSLTLLRLKYQGMEVADGLARLLPTRLFDPFFCCLLLSEKRRHSLFIRLLTEPDREELHCQTIQMI